MLAALAVAAVLKGTVSIGPMRPVCRVGMRCDQAAAHVVLTFRRGARALTARTNAAGAYVVTLSPGTYSVSASAGLRIAPDLVTVRAGTQRRSFAIDTGIR